MIQEQSDQQIFELQIASKLDEKLNQSRLSIPVYQNFYDASQVSQSSIQKGTHPEGFQNEDTKDVKSNEMSEFSLIIQEGLQNARRQSQQEMVMNQILSQIRRNHEILISQTEEIDHLMRVQILQEQEQQLAQRTQKLLTELKKLQEHFNQIKSENKGYKVRILSPSPFHKKSHKNKNQERIFTSKKTNIIRNNFRNRNQDVPDSNITKRPYSYQKRGSSFDYFESIRSKETIQKQKKILENRIKIVRESIRETISSNRNKIQRLSYENELLMSEIKLTENQIYDFEKKRPFKKQKTVKYGSKNLHNLMEVRKNSLRARKSSFTKKQALKHRAFSGHSLSKKHLRIVSAQENKSPFNQKQAIKSSAVRDEYFDQGMLTKRIVTHEEIPLKKTDYY